MIKKHYTHFKKANESPFLQSKSSDFFLKKHLHDVEVFFFHFQVHTTII